MSELKLHVLDVGQGASAVLDFGSNLYGIVDCGGSKSGTDAAIVKFLEEAIFLEPKTRILFLLVTHLDVDHIRAVSALMSRPGIKDRIERLYCNQLAYRELFYAARAKIRPGSGAGTNSNNGPALSALRYLGTLNNLVKQNKEKQDFHLECTAPEAGDLTRYPVRLNVPGIPDDFEVDLWAPSQDLRNQASGPINLTPEELHRAIFSGREIEDWNAASIVITISVNGRRILLAGDATKETWAYILNRGKGKWSGADVAVAWHHGGRLGPMSGHNYDSHVWQQVLSRHVKVVCISCGSHNRYGHPHRDTIEAITSLAGTVYCTERAAPKITEQLRFQDETVLMLAAMSRKKLWVEDDRSGKCCGNIVVHIDSVGNVTPECSSVKCAERSKEHPCCTDHGGTLVKIGESPDI
jgi:beta-lactamase superfamily II metal-dependent hydrolase